MNVCINQLEFEINIEIKNKLMEEETHIVKLNCLSAKYLCG